MSLQSHDANSRPVEQESLIRAVIPAKSHSLELDVFSGLELVTPIASCRSPGPNGPAADRWCDLIAKAEVVGQLESSGPESLQHPVPEWLVDSGPEGVVASTARAGQHLSTQSFWWHVLVRQVGCREADWALVEVEPHDRADYRN